MYLRYTGKASCWSQLITRPTAPTHTFYRSSASGMLPACHIKHAQANLKGGREC